MSAPVIVQACADRQGQLVSLPTWAVGPKEWGGVGLRLTGCSGMWGSLRTALGIPAERNRCTRPLVWHESKPTCAAGERGEQMSKKSPKVIVVAPGNSPKAPADAPVSPSLAWE